MSENNTELNTNLSVQNYQSTGQTFTDSKRNLKVKNINVDFVDHNQADTSKMNPIQKFHSQHITNLHQSMEQKDKKKLKQHLNEYHDNLDLAKKEHSERTTTQGYQPDQNQQEVFDNQMLDELEQINMALYGETGKHQNWFYHFIYLCFQAIYIYWTVRGYSALTDAKDADYITDSPCDKMYDYQYPYSIFVAAMIPLTFLTQIYVCAGAKYAGTRKGMRILKQKAQIESVSACVGFAQFVCLCGLTHWLDKNECGDFGGFCRFSMVLGWCFGLVGLAVIVCFCCCLAAIMPSLGD